MSKNYRGGFDVGIMSKAMTIGNETRERNAQEDAALAERPSGSRMGASRRTLGKLYAFGSGDYGKLGHGNTAMQANPKLVEILRDKDIVKVASGARFTLAMSSDGKVWSWGYGGDGQLGHGDFQLQTMPTQIKYLERENVIAIECGEKHAAALTSGGELFTWGEGSQGQLGLGDFSKQNVPHRVTELQGKMVLRVSCGKEHTACITDDSSVYTFGAGGSGRLGHGNEHNLATPMLVQALEVITRALVPVCVRVCACVCAYVPMCMRTRGSPSVLVALEAHMHL